MTQINDNATASPGGKHHRKASVGLSPFWVDESKNQGNTTTPVTSQDINDNEAIGSPKVSERGIVEFPMDAIAFFPLPVDDLASDERGLLFGKRTSRRASTPRSAAPVPPALVAAAAAIPVAVEDTIVTEAPLSPDGATKALVDIEGLPPGLMIGGNHEKSSTSSNSTVATGNDSFRSEFSENTAGSKFSMPRVSCFSCSFYGFEVDVILRRLLDILTCTSINK